jgi:hypothetical protein
LLSPAQAGLISPVGPHGSNTPWPNDVKHVKTQNKKDNNFVLRITPIFILSKKYYHNMMTKKKEKCCTEI